MVKQSFNGEEEYGDLESGKVLFLFPGSFSRGIYFTVCLHCRMAKDARSVGPLKVLEIEKAKNVLIQQSQEQSFPAEVAALRKGRSISSKSNLGSLTPFIDEDGIIRAGGRIDKAEIPFIARHPVILASDNELTRLIVMDCHETPGHAGVDYVRNELRQRLWIL